MLVYQYLVRINTSILLVVSTQEEVINSVQRFKMVVVLSDYSLSGLNKASADNSLTIAYGY